MIGVHLNRLILHMVFRDPAVWKLNNDDADLAELAEAARSAAKRIFQPVASYLELHHKGEYLASFSKSREKCAGVVRALTEEAEKPESPADGQLSMLKDMEPEG